MKMKKALVQLKKILRSYTGRSIKENVNNEHHSKRCLLVYIITPFKKNFVDDTSHQNIWQVRELARIVGTFGYEVDVIHYNDCNVFLRHTYDLVLDIYPNPHSPYIGKLKSNAKKIAYLTGSGAQFAAYAEEMRIKECYQRRGILLEQRRTVEYYPHIMDSFDAAFLIGNNFTRQTYPELSSKPVFLLPNTGYEFDVHNIDYSRKEKKNFLYFGSVGQIHKGLDLLLEVFSQPGFPCTLYVCGPYEEERDFIELYYNELYNTDNIKPEGYVKIYSEKFFELMSVCTFAILPSCSEGMAGSINVAMSAGVIPVCSRECGFNEDEVILLPDCQISSIEKSVLELSVLDNDCLKARSEYTISIAKKRYSKKAFTDAVYKGLTCILDSDLQKGN